MLTLSELMQNLTRNARGEVVNTSTTVEVEQVVEPVVESATRLKATRPPSTRDVPSCELRVGKVVVRYEVDDLDPSNPRWVYRIAAGKVELAGLVGNPLDPADMAHELAGLGPVVRPAPPTKLGNTVEPISTRSR